MPSIQNRRHLQGQARYPEKDRRRLPRRDQKAGLSDAIWQAFAVLLLIQTVGVMGEGRPHGFVCAHRTVTLTDGMTDYYHFDHDFLSRTATRIINEVREHQPGGL